MRRSHSRLTRLDVGFVDVRMGLILAIRGDCVTLVLQTARRQIAAME